MKKSVILLYIVVVAVMATATIVEKYEGTPFVSDNIYGAWWFSALWALLAAAAVFYFLKQRVRRLSLVVLHLSFVVILAGALLTHLTSRRGMIHVRQGETAITYVTPDMSVHRLPFSVRLDKFEVTYHDGTSSPSDYTSLLTIDGLQYSVSMNNIASHSGYRLYQSSYDEDLCGTVLALNSDPWGIPVTYTGYALLFIGLLWMLVDPRGTYRQLLRRTALPLLLLATVPVTTLGQENTPPTLPPATADKLGRLHILYNNRITPVQTYALDFTKKISGRRSYRGLSAEQVLSGFIFWPHEWASEAVIKVKGGALKSTLQLPDRCSVNTFFNPTMGGYILGPYIREYYSGNNDSFHKDAAKMDDRLMLIMELRSEAPLTKLTRHLSEDARAGRFDRVDEKLDRLLKQQRRSEPLPTTLQQRAERLYNALPIATILFMANLTLGFLALGVFIWKMKRSGQLNARPMPVVSYLLLALSFLALTACLVLRWIITGHVPMSNGYETMLTLAWFIMLLALLIYRRFPIVLIFGFLLSGFFLLVSHINQMDPQIGHLMPVLNSPLLSLHVSIIMMSFALLAMTFICGLTALCLPKLQEQLQLLSQLMLYPALTTLGVGIFIGAIWANISWGTYWSWDPKEVWALITFMVYAVAVHGGSLPFLRQPKAYHTYMTLAFLTILMTYFGVNFFLGGMHSYA